MATAARVKYPAALQRYKLDTPLLAAGYLILYHIRVTINRSKLETVDVGEYVVHQIKHLVIPYFWMCFLMYPFWFFTYHFITNGTKLTTAKAFWGILIGNSSILGSPSNALWFVLTLFLANLLFLFLCRLAKGNEAVLPGLVVLCGIIGYLDEGRAQLWHLHFLPLLFYL